MCTQNGFFPLFVASHKGYDRIVDLLLQAGATVDLQDKVGNCCGVPCEVLFACTPTTTQHSGKSENTSYT